MISSADTIANIKNIADIQTLFLESKTNEDKMLKKDQSKISVSRNEIKWW
jgi:hypothetical protein